MYNSDMNKHRHRSNERIITIILKNHFEEFKNTKLIKLKDNEMRKHIVNVVEKALTCGDPEYGYVKYKCETCDNEHIHGFSCKSKFCTKCGRMYSINWAEKQSQNMLKVKHRHSVFTIPKELRNYFYKKRSLMKDLQDAVYRVISYFYENKVKGSHEAGVITVLHTFGSDLKWNPHVHALLTEGGIDKVHKWFKPLQHIPYQYLRKAWQKQVLDIIRKNFKDIKTKQLINRLYCDYPHGFYVNAERDLTNINQAAKYIGRYLARPAIAEYRITNYDGKTVSFWYEKKNPKERVEITMDVLDFIGKLVNHIHPKGFRVVRRYGLYSRRKNKLSIEVLKLFNFMKQCKISEVLNRIKTKKKNFKDRLIETFGVNPFLCKKCNKEMMLWEIWFPKSGIIYHALDKKNYFDIIDRDYAQLNINKHETMNQSMQLCLF